MHVPRALAQSVPAGEPDPAKVKVRIGPLWMNPSVSLTNLGVDNNVFNVPADENPQSDFTLTVTPTTDMWLRMGRTWFTGTIKEEVIWYQTYASQRAANNAYSVGWKVPLNRLTMNGSASYLRAKDRPGFEIDTRSSRTEIAYRGTVEIRALSKTYFGVRAERLSENFDQDQVFLASNLRFELNRVTTTGGLSVRQQVTPLTSISIEASRSQDRFEFSSLRDSNSTAISSTISFDPYALIKGSATFGYRDFEPLSPGLPSFNGAIAAVDLSYTLLGTTRFSVRANRDVQYSYDVNQPYYLLTGFDFSIAQQLFGPVDIVGRVGLQALAYRDRVGADIALSNRTDHIQTYGGGIGYHMGKDLRLGFNVDKSRRISDIGLRTYDNLRFGMSVTYGI